MAGRGHHTSHHGKHHVSHHHEESAHMEHHHHARGGKVKEEGEGSPEEDRREERDGKMHKYTADSPIMKESEEEGPTFSKGGRAKKAAGGKVHHEGKHHVSHHHHEAAKVSHIHMKRGGHMKHVEGEGHKMARRMDRPGRKRGGGVGADMTPLTTAAKTTQGHAHTADNDELAH
jgi:hypothetical protein